MHETDIYPVIIFIVSFYVFGALLIYSLARAWEQALSARRIVFKVEVAPANDESGLSSQALFAKRAAELSDPIQHQDRES